MNPRASAPVDAGGRTRRPCARELSVGPPSARVSGVLGRSGHGVGARRGGHSPRRREPASFTAGGSVRAPDDWRGAIHRRTADPGWPRAASHRLHGGGTTDSVPGRPGVVSPSGRSRPLLASGLNRSRPLPGFAVDSFSRLLWWLFSSSAGAKTRTSVMRALRDRPQNAQQLAVGLGLDYTTVRHHLRILVENRLVESSGEHYGQVYSIASIVEARWNEIEHIASRHRR